MEPRVDGFEVARVHVPDHRQHMLLQGDDHRPGQEMAGQAVADVAFVGLHLAEHEVLLLLAAVALDTAFQQRNGDGKAVQAGSDVLDFHRRLPNPLLAEQSWTSV